MSRKIAPSCKPGVVALTLPVTYWDYLGWKDTLALPAFAERQRGYAAAHGERPVFTPQAMVDGLTSANGSDRSAIETGLRTADAPIAPVSVSEKGDRLVVEVGAAVASVLVALVVLLAGLSMVPGEIEEAAKLETKKWFTILRYVQLPFLIPGLVAVLILRTADTLKLFDMVFTLTRGGPGASTEFISLMIQRVGFRAFDQGLASAQAIILLIITIILAQIYIRVFYKEV